MNKLVSENFDLIFMFFSLKRLIHNLVIIYAFSENMVDSNVEN